VVAAGVWSGGLSPGVALRPSRGSHLLVAAGRLGDPRAGVSVPVPGERARWVFTLPRADGLVAIGLTDVPADGPVPDEPVPDAAEEAELLTHASAALDTALDPSDVAGRYAGLRPLLAAGADAGCATADLSRRHAVLEDPGTRALTVVGGKLTTYRRMAQDVVDRLTERPCRTHRLALVGAAAPGDRVTTVGSAWHPLDGSAVVGHRHPLDGSAVVGHMHPLDGSAVVGHRLMRRFGAEAPAVAALADGRPELLEPVAPGVPVCGAELLWAAAHELALTDADLADRRTRAGLVPEWRAAVIATAARLELSEVSTPG
jgi:glycerol-3-phosphate dehydrogenase